MSRERGKPWPPFPQEESAAQHKTLLLRFFQRKTTNQPKSMKIYSESELTAIFREVAGPQNPHIYTAHSLVLTPEPAIWTIGPIAVPLRGPVDYSPAPVRPPRPPHAHSAHRMIELLAQIGKNWRALLLDAAEGDEALAELISREATFGLRYGATMH